jgi:TctA family transporter
MSEKLIEVMLDAATGEVTERELTKEEVTSHKATLEGLMAADKAKADAKESALAKLAALGLTEEEIAAL